MPGADTSKPLTARSETYSLSQYKDEYSEHPDIVMSSCVDQEFLALFASGGGGLPQARWLPLLPTIAAVRMLACTCGRLLSFVRCVCRVPSVSLRRLAAGGRHSARVPDGAPKQARLEPGGWIRTVLPQNTCLRPPPCPSPCPVPTTLRCPPPGAERSSRTARVAPSCNS